MANKNQLRKQNLKDFLEILIQQKDSLRNVLEKLEEVFDEVENNPYGYDLREDLDDDAELLITDDFYLNDEVDKLQKLDYYQCLEVAIVELSDYCDQAEKIIDGLEEFLNSSRAK